MLLLTNILLKEHIFVGCLLTSYFLCFITIHLLFPSRNYLFIQLEKNMPFTIWSGPNYIHNKIIFLGMYYLVHIPQVKYPQSLKLCSFLVIIALRQCRPKLVCVKGRVLLHDNTPPPPQFEHTSPSFMFFIPISPFPFLPFLFFFFLQQHFLTMQKQQVRIRVAATTAMAMMAHDGTDMHTQTTHTDTHKHITKENSLTFDQPMISPC